MDMSYNTMRVRSHEQERKKEQWRLKKLLTKLNQRLIIEDGNPCPLS